MRGGGDLRRAVERNEMGDVHKPDQERPLCHIKDFEYYLEDNWEISNEL